MRQAFCAFAAMLVSGCAEEDVLKRPDPHPGVQISTVEAAPMCKPVDAVQVRAGYHDPTANELLGAVAAERGANYVVVDASAVVTDNEDIFAIQFARLFQCPVRLFYPRCVAVISPPAAQSNPPAPGPAE